MTGFPETASQLDGASFNGAARILVVDDEQYMCDICSRTLRSAAYDVVATSSTDVALRELRGPRPFDLLLVDIKMPGMSGLELAQKAREVDPAIAIIIMTGHASTENLHQAVRRGVADFIAKPFELEELRLAVDQALHKRLLTQDSVRLRAVEHLLRSSEAINATLDGPQLSRIILQTALQQVPCTAGFLLLGDDQQPGETLASDDSWQLLNHGREVALHAYHSGQPLVIAGADALCGDGVQQIGRGLAMPLRAQGEAVGVLLLCDDRPEVLRPGTQEIIALLANQSGTALRNAHLYGKLQEAYQRQQELDRLKSEFIAIASHELRTPLSIILGYAMMMRDQNDGEQREYAQRVLQSAQNIKDIVDDMVSLRNLDLHVARLNIEIYSLHDLVAQAVEWMTPAAQQKSHTLTTSLPDGPVAFLADREKILLVLGNLLSNAIKFTPPGGTIHVAAAVWPASHVLETARSSTIPPTLNHILSEQRHEAYIVIQVSDTGIGIPAREQPRIFERFYQVADSLTREHGGTGLGLAIVHDLIELQGGMIWVESTEHAGSTFSFALPYQTAAPPDTPSSEK